MTMPENLFQWFFFAFYTLGSAGGIIVLIIIMRETWQSWSERRR